MFQPCHRCDRARSAISVPSPRYSSFLSVGTSLLRLVRSVTISLSLEFNRSPLNLDSNLVTRPTATTSRLCPRNSTDGGSISTCKPSAPAFLCSLSPRTPKKPSLLSALPPHATSIERYPQNLSHYACRHAFLLLASSVGRSDPSIDIGVRYYPDRDQWSPIFNPRVVPDDNADGNKGPIEAVGNKGPIEAVGNQGPVDIKPIVEAKEKGPAEATVDPASINTILACSASLVYIPKGMEIVETRTHYYPLKDKWHAINDPSRHYDCPHPFVCVPWSVHDPELPPGLPVPFLRNLNLPVPAPTPAPSTSSSESSSNDSDSSSTYPLISNYINLNHQGVQKLLLDDNTPPTAVCIYTEEDVMRIFEGIAPEYVDMCSEYPPSSLAESDRRVMFFENMQWFFRNKRSTYLSTRKF
ncbi:hypothetical protein PGTUg99_022755 [Puccinia graminis f. sp. tritici]|uniref:Uncharacterized protein n=1 Tax=Puccinia graminis f. sp. tritici TaxID=56615 RepID=A0A5B0MX50_PUCGR|nr:hypothetical protein PGTUg99_022755 [Puccinia graminis f. sp. tritici]